MSRNRRGGLSTEAWKRVWKRFDEKYDSSQMAPRNKVQKRWIMEFVNFELKHPDKSVEILKGVYYSGKREARP